MSPINVDNNKEKNNPTKNVIVTVHLKSVFDLRLNW